MIIWGKKGRAIEVAAGQFHCPQCESEQRYQRLRVASYFTLYFVPLFETEHHGDYVQCSRCNGQFNPAVLEYIPPSPGERLLRTIRADLESGTPVQMVRTKMANAGFSKEGAEKFVDFAAGEDLKWCSACRLTFIKGFARCSACGVGLEEVFEPLTYTVKKVLHRGPVAKSSNSI